MKSDELLGQLGRAHAAETRLAARTLNLMVDAADARQGEAELEENATKRRYLISSIADEIAVELGCTVNFVQNSLFRARLVRSKLPLTWARFEAGEVSAFCVREIGRHVARLEREESFELFDHRCAEYATTHSDAQTSVWAKRRVATLEPQTLEQREKRAWEERKVVLSYDEEGHGGELWAQLPTLQLLEIERSLEESLLDKVADDDRTVGQYLADQMHARLTQTADGTSLVSTEVLVTVPVTTLASLDDEPGTTIDGRVLLPASTVRELASLEGTVFHRVVTDPFGGVLDVTRLGRFFTGALRTAIEVRDGGCQFPGCGRAAQRGEIDHITAWPDGPTSGNNGQKLCKRHHQLKTAGVLHPEHTDNGILWTFPSGRQAQSHRAEHPPGPIRWFPDNAVA
jgi:hypothetical protein